MFGVPRKIILWDDAPGAGIDLHHICGYLGRHLPLVEIMVEGAYFSRPGLPLEEVADKFARARVRNVLRQSTGQQPLAGEVAYERRRLEGRAGAVFGIPYDGFRIQELASSLLPPHRNPPPPGQRVGEGVKTSLQAQLETRNRRAETGFAAHIIFTNQLLGTWDADDRRFHLRAAVYGFPSLISTSGIVEAPAKPRGYYYLRDRLTAVGQQEMASGAARKEFAGSFLRHGDERLTEVAKGYVMQAVFFHTTGEPFCGDPNCRLFNAHWQEELLRSQLTKPEFCERHERLLEDLRVQR